MTINEQHVEKLAARGKSDGENAGNSYFDGNTTERAYRGVLKGIEDGDPAVLDELPFADLSGQWADGDTAESLCREELGDEELETYLHTEDDGDAENGPHISQWYELDDLITAYEDAYSAAAQGVIEMTCRHQLAPND